MRDLRRSDEDRVRLLGKILREALEPDIWLFTTVEEVNSRWDQLERHLGRRRDFWHFLLGRWREQRLLRSMPALTDLQLLGKISIGRIVIDSAQEILANKLCALLSRTEVRDLVDVARLEEAGNDPMAALGLAFRKDAGMSAGQLAWVLSSFPIPADPSSLYGMSQTDLEDFGSLW